MNDADLALSRLEELVLEEREAIRRLLAERVEAAAVEKEALFGVLVDALPGRTDLYPRFRELLAALRHNGVLLAHGRDCLRDAVGALCGEAPRPAGTTRPVAPVLRTGARVSVTG